MCLSLSDKLNSMLIGCGSVLPLKSITCYVESARVMLNPNAKSQWKYLCNPQPSFSATQPTACSWGEITLD